MNILHTKKALVPVKSPATVPLISPNGLCYTGIEEKQLIAYRCSVFLYLPLHVTA
jgi:hypothetical protein